MAKLTLRLGGVSNKIPDKLLTLEPTHASRYWVVAQLLRQLFDDTKNVHLLDVGGKKGLIGQVSNIDYTILDIEASNEKHYVQGNALAMTFADNAFDVVISCDVLEHIAAADRQQFISELVRVSSRFVIIAAPFDHGGNARAERDMNDYYKRLSGADHRWLLEHVENGLPSESEVQTSLRRLRVQSVLQFRHFSLRQWRLIVRMHLLQAVFGDSKAIAQANKRYFERYYQTICNIDYGDDGYRTFFVIAKRDDISLDLQSQVEDAVQTDSAAQEVLLDALEAQAREWLQAAQKANTYVRKLAYTTAELAARNQQATAAEIELNRIHAMKAWKAASKVKHLRRRAVGVVKRGPAV